ncbi:copper resistance protein [Rhodococcus jostii RHA1] [Mycobacterium shimoidei]|uniref:Copper resistance protein [Rhodococcus jostii RHA1] n=1 Tax=Mycobacterium shimoidei TaxID=29313 RepID=A0A375YVP5_MYCSH|nr:copper resistance protein [Rhodococcus jostii RHA1] [Mycobacterium shimoidei]
MLLHRLVATGLLLLGLACAGTATAGTVGAHAVRVGTTPAEGAVVEKGPEQVSATFNEPLQPAFAAMTVVGPDGNLWSSGKPQVAGAVISVGLRPLGPAGTYTVNYRVTSADGHVVTGSWSFQLAVPGTGQPGPGAHTGGAGGDGVPIWPFVAGAVVLVGAGAFWAVRQQS